jgi:hypothetical protein
VKEKEKIYSLLLVEGKVWSCSDERYSKCVIRIWDATDVRGTLRTGCKRRPVCV